MRDDRKRAGGPELVTASEIAAFVYCKEQWRLEYGLRLEAGNRAARDAGNRHHFRKAAGERLAAGFIALGRVAVAVALLILVVLLLWLVWR